MKTTIGSSLRATSRIRGSTTLTLFACPADSRIYSWGMLAHSQLGYDLEDTLFIDMKREQSSYLRSVPRRRTAILSIQEHLLAKLSPNLPVGTAIEEEEEEEAMQLATRKEVQAVFALPKEVVALREKNVTKISAGHGFALALTQSGTIFGWGKNDQGQLGQGGSSRILVCADGYLACNDSKQHHVLSFSALFMMGFRLSLTLSTV